MVKKVISDGWHEQKDGSSIYTENGIIIRAIKRDHNGVFVPASVYIKAFQTVVWNALAI